MSPNDKKPGPPVDEDLSEIDRFAESEGSATAQGTVVAEIPINLDDNAPAPRNERGATMAGTQIEPLPENVSATIELEGAAQRFFIVTKTVTVIGRAGGAADLVLPWNEEASRQHCAVLFANGAFWLEDLQSSNGTFVNEQQVQRTRLKSGDKIRIGTQVLTFGFKM